MLAALDAEECWDIVIIGGGATGLGTAVDAATRGYRTLLVEQGDFAHAPPWRLNLRSTSHRCALRHQC
ncbi:MAG TPA: hypothetical protein DIC52_21765, partial [Candidatus Latescibacteria bacterium]|nr:hypothetical protein [Candidatus Latescibacterota bacterium]